MGWTVRDRIPVGTRFSARPDRPWGPPSLPYNGYRVFPGGKVRPGRAADPSSAAVTEDYSYTSTHPLGHTGPVTGTFYFTHFLWRLRRPQGHSAAGRIISVKNSEVTIGNPIRDLPACSAVPQLTAAPHAPLTIQ